MAGPNAPHEPDEEKPLDPAAERVRRKLVRFMGINLAILFAAVMAVVLAFVYKSLVLEAGEAPAQPISASVPSGETLSGLIELPAGARIVSHAASGNRLTLHLRLDDGGEAILVYDMATARPVGRFEIARALP